MNHLQKGGGYFYMVTENPNLLYKTITIQDCIPYYNTQWNNVYKSFFEIANYSNVSLVALCNIYNFEYCKIDSQHSGIYKINNSTTSTTVTTSILEEQYIVRGIPIS